MNTKKITIGNKIIILTALLLCFAGIIMSVYIPKQIYKESATLAHTPVIFEMFGLHVKYTILCIIGLIAVAVLFTVRVTINKIRHSCISCIAAMFILLLSPAIPMFLNQPWYKYQFAGFTNGVIENIDEYKLKDWIEHSISNYEQNGGHIFDKGDLNFLSKSGLFECEAHLKINNKDDYNVIMYWGGGAVTSYGLYIGTEKETFQYMQENYEVIEIFDVIYAWTYN